MLSQQWNKLMNGTAWNAYDKCVQGAKLSRANSNGHCEWKGTTKSKKNKWKVAGEIIMWLYCSVTARVYGRQIKIATKNVRDEAKTNERRRKKETRKDKKWKEKKRHKRVKWTMNTEYTIFLLRLCSRWVKSTPTIRWYETC